MDSSTGKIKWRKIRTRPESISIGTNGDLYLYHSYAFENMRTSDPYEGYLTAINSKTGNVKWRFRPAEGNFRGCGPAIGPDGTVYAGDNYNLYAIDPNSGKEKWIAKRCGLSISGLPPMAVASGELYLVKDTSIVVLNPKTGQLTRRIPMKSSYSQAAAMGADGAIYVVSDECNIIAVK